MVHRFLVLYSLTLTLLCTGPLLNVWAKNAKQIPVTPIHDGVYPNNKWDRYFFELPGDSGSAMIDVRHTQFSNESEYRLRGKFHEKNFAVEPCMQTGGAPDLHLEWFDRLSQGGPFIVITHDDSNYQGYKTEVLDLETGLLYSQTKSVENIIALLKKKAGILLGNLDGSCRFNLPHTTSTKHEMIAPEPKQKRSINEERKNYFNKSDLTIRELFQMHRADFIELAEMFIKEKRLMDLQSYGKAANFYRKDIGSKNNDCCQYLEADKANDKQFEKADITRERFKIYMQLMEKIGTKNIDRDEDNLEIRFEMTTYPLDNKTVCFRRGGVPSTYCWMKDRSAAYEIVSDTEKPSININDLHLASQIEKDWYILRDREPRETD